MDKRNTIRLIIWGLLFIIAFGFGIIGLANSKANQSNIEYNYKYTEE